MYWATKAIEAEKEGFLGPEESEKFLKSLGKKHAGTRHKQK